MTCCNVDVYVDMNDVYLRARADSSAWRAKKPLAHVIQKMYLITLQYKPVALLPFGERILLIFLCKISVKMA